MATKSNIIITHIFMFACYLKSCFRHCKLLKSYLFLEKKQKMIITNFSTHSTWHLIHMLYYFDINTCIVTTVSGVSNTLTRHATLRLQLVWHKSSTTKLNINRIIIKNQINSKLSVFGFLNLSRQDRFVVSKHAYAMSTEINH